MLKVIMNVAAVAGFILAGMLGGCATRSVVVDTLADRAHAATEERPAVFVVMASDDDGSLLASDALSLEERNVMTGVREAFVGYGFDVVDQLPAEVMVSVSTFTVSGERESWRTVPVHEHTHGTIDTKDGPRRFHGTTSTSVVVPQRVAYTHRHIVLVAVPGGDDVSAYDESAAFWIGRMHGSRSVIDEDVTAAVGRLLEYWGVTATRTVRY